MHIANTSTLNAYRHLMKDTLYRNSIFLIASSAASSVFGFGFWIIAARIYSANTIGIVSTVIAASSLLATLSFFGFDYALIKFIPGSKHAESRTHTVLTFTAAASVIIATIYLLMIPVVVPKISFLISSPWWIAGFIALVISATWNTLTNSIFIAHRIAQFTLIATILFGIIRFPLLFALRSEHVDGLLITQITALIVCVMLCFVFLKKYASYTYKIRIIRSDLKFMASYAFGTYLSNVSGGIPALILPMIILKMLGAKPAAFFYIANMITSLLYIIPSATGQALFAEANWNSDNINQQILKAGKLIYVLVIVFVMAVICLGWLILSAFGIEYARNGYWMLFFLSVTTLPKIFSYLFSTVLRVYAHIKAVIIVATIGTIIQLVASYIGMRVTNNLITIGLAALLCEIFVSSSYTILYFYYKRNNGFNNHRVAL